ncbi:MAG TPA: maleylpyruvate isomerase family mycothiol-dependent enzyme [Streptosporangiaceae bacterium]
MEQDPRAWIAALRNSHNRLASLVSSLTADQRRGPSYCRDWNVAQVLSHLGSGAEISLLMLPAALGEAQASGPQAPQPIWDAWNAKTPDQQVADGLISDEKYVQSLEALSDDELGRISLEIFGMNLDSVGLIRLRLGEHVPHTWDVAVSLDPAATLSPDAVTLLIDNVPQFLAPRLGRPPEDAFRVRIVTTEPDRDYLLIAGEEISMPDWPGDGAGADSEARMPAEALLRLAYGRMDPGHTPAEVVADAADLDRLRSLFPGF